MAVNVSSKYREIIYSGGAINRATLLINNNEIDNSNIKRITISSPIIDETVDYFYIGTFIAQKVEIEFKNNTELDLQGLVNLSIGTKTDDSEYAGADGFEDIYIGEFYIDTSPEDYSKSSKLTCYDASILFKQNVDISEFFDVNEEVTAENLLIGLCNKFLGQNMLGTYPNINRNITTWYYDTSKSGKYYISKIAEIMGGNAKIGRDGKLYIIPLKQVSSVTINALASKSWTLQSKYKISRVFWQNGNIVFERGTQNNNSLNISVDNVFLYGTENNIQEAINNIYDELNGFEMYSLKTENYGDVSLDCWDLINFSLGEENYNALNNNTIVYEMNIATTIDAKIPSKQKEEVTNVIGNILKTTNLMKTEIIQNEKEIKALADRIVDVANSITGMGAIRLENAFEGELNKLSIKGDISLLFPQSSFQSGHPLVPRNGLVPSNSLVPSSPVPYGNDVYYPSSNLFTKSNVLLIDDVEYKLDFDFLNYYDKNVYDEFVYENGECSIIRRVGINSQGEKYALDPSEYVTEPRKPILLEVKENSIIKLKSFDNAILTATYLLQNSLTETFATQVELHSEIQQTAENITSTVEAIYERKDDAQRQYTQINQTANEISQTVANNNTKANIIAKINDNTSLAKIDADNVDIVANDVLNILSGSTINLTGKNIAISSTNFSVDKNGNVTANSATLNNVTVNGGTLKLSNNATISGDNGLITSLIYPGNVRSSIFVGSADFFPVGHMGGGDTVNTNRSAMVFMFKLPANFTIKSAKIYITHCPINWKIGDYGSSYTIPGWSRNLNLYKITSTALEIDMVSYTAPYSTSYTPITNAFGSNGFTGSSSSITYGESIDIKNHISLTGINEFAILTSNGVQSGDEAFRQTGGLNGYIEIIGYTKFTN